MSRNETQAPADSQPIVESPEGEVVSATLDEVITVGDERHGVHNPLPLDRDALGVHKAPSPEQAFASGDLESKARAYDLENPQVDLPESDLDGESGHRGAVVRTLTPGQGTPEQAFAAESADPDYQARANEAAREPSTE